MEEPIEGEGIEVEIDAELYDDLTIRAKKLGCTEEEILERAITRMLESAKPSP